MVDREIFSRRLVALRAYLDKPRAFRDTAEDEFGRTPALHDLAERYLPLAVRLPQHSGARVSRDRSWHRVARDPERARRSRRIRALGRDEAPVGTGANGVLGALASPDRVR